MQETERSCYTVREICDIIGVACTVPDAEVKRFYYYNNTRFRSACAYFTVKGELFDGHIFDEAQLKKNAVVVFSDRNYEGLPCIFVEDPREAFLRFAEAARSRFPAKAIAVTGSTGKTSTKEMLYAALQAGALTLKTRDTNNSIMESAYLVSQMKPEHSFFVVEMGLRRPNQCFVRNSEMVKPDVCILTNIGNSHIENFRDKAHILEEKYLITAGMREDGLVLVNGDDPLLWQLQCPFEKQTFAIENKNADYVAENVVLENERTTFTAVFPGGRMDVVLPVPGRHNVFNALAAIAVCRRYGIEEELILEGLASFTTQGHRQNVIRQEGVGTIISDCVSATPESMQVAFDWLQAMKCEPGGRKWAVLGHMMRLGRHSVQMHRDVGQMLQEYDFDQIVTYSGHAYYIAEEAAKAGIPVAHFYTKTDAIRYLKEGLRSEDMTLFKGVGKFCHFEELAEGVLKQNVPDEEAEYAGRYKNERDLHSDAQASIVVDQKSFQILHGKNIHKQLQAASLSMVLSALVILEKMHMDAAVCVTAADIQDAKGSATAKLKAGERYSVKDLLAAGLLRSAADAMLALARHTAGTVDAFVAMMNERAAELGAVSSYFATPTGKNSRRYHTTVFDLALILREALKRADFRELAFAAEMKITELESGAERVLKTNNRLLFHEKRDQYLDYYCAHARGIKAGSNSLAGDCLMSVREYETDRYILGISLGSRDYDYNKLSYLDMARLLTFPYEL